MGYQDVKDRLYHGHRKIANNTYITMDNEIEGDFILHPIYMRLHSNLIAKFYYNHLELYSAGWYTTTTKSRLNLALEIANCPQGIGQINYVWYLYGKQEFYDGIKIDYAGKVLS